MYLENLVRAKPMRLVRKVPAIGPNSETMFRTPRGRPAYHTFQETLFTYSFLF